MHKSSLKRWIEIRTNKEKILQKSDETRKKYDESKLKKSSLCSILQKHHDTLVNDSEKLSTEFMLSLIKDAKKSKKSKK